MSEIGQPIREHEVEEAPAIPHKPKEIPAPAPERERERELVPAGPAEKEND